MSTAMTQIVDRLYQSGWPVPPSELAAMRYVFDVAGVAGVGMAGAPTPSYVLVQRPIPDGVAPPREWLMETVRMVIEAMGQGNVLVHCGAGVSRSSLVTMATVMALTGWDRERAAALVRRVRPWANPCPPMWEQLEELRDLLPAARCQTLLGRP